MKLRGEDQLGHQRGRDMFSFAYTHTVWPTVPRVLSHGSFLANKFAPLVC
jgi:hypothetical protein